MSVGRADCFDFKVHFTLRSYLPQCPFNFEGMCYISSDYSELFSSFVVVVVVVVVVVFCFVFCFCFCCLFFV